MLHDLNWFAFMFVIVNNHSLLYPFILFLQREGQTGEIETIRGLSPNSGPYIEQSISSGDILGDIFNLWTAHEVM